MSSAGRCLPTLACLAPSVVDAGREEAFFPITAVKRYHSIGTADPGMRALGVLQPSGFMNGS
jgi:hypothetical protein